MCTTKETIAFNYSAEDAALFQNGQGEYWRSIEEDYVRLRTHCLEEIPTPIEASHKVWVASRVNKLLTTSITRMLYLAESFCDASNNFNAQSAAIHVKAMTEPALHIANLAWILENRNDFESIRRELDIMSFGNRREGTGLTAGPRINHTDLVQRADALMRRMGGEGDGEDVLNIFESIYRESNAVGHHNFEGRDLLAGIMGADNIWRPKPRKEWFIFISSNIFQFFLYTQVLFGMSNIFVRAIEHYLQQMPEELPENGESV